MKTRISLCTAVALAAVFLCCGATAAETVCLDGAWRLTSFEQPDDGAVRALPLPKGVATKSYAATVPGCCELELVKAGELPDPLVGFNAFQFRPCEGLQWLYEKTFVAPKRVPGERCVLVFDGIDTLADVFLNGEKVGEAANMLIAHEFDVTGRLREGEENRLAVLLRPVGLAAREVTVGELGRTMNGGADHERFRKAAHMYGWDIMPRLPVSGLWRSVRLEVRPAVRIDQPAWIVRTLDAKQKTANFLATCRIHAPFRHYYKAHVRARLSLNGTVCATTEQPFRGAHVKAALHLRDARLWWPRGAGAQPLYDATFELIGEKGDVLASNTSRIGVRTIALDYDDRLPPDRPGRFLFKVNDTPIYVRGVNWVPLDPIPSEQARHFDAVLPMMADLNANLVRVWGGGVYEPDAFFDWCDANGVMVWQDFMTACAVPPQDDAFAARFGAETLSVVLRLRNHASLALWAGDNENDLASTWSLWKLARDPNTYRITREVIPNVLKEYDVTRPYLPSSPYVTREAFAKKTIPAEDHMWGGPRGWWKTKYYTDAACWFCSEGGAHAVPCRRSLERMMGKAAAERPWKNPDAAKWQDLDWTDEWRYRSSCPNLSPRFDPWGRNDIVLRQCAALFGDVPRHDLDLFIAQSQSAQAESIKFQVENFRSQKFVGKGGFVVWNLRDGWPTLSDAFTDYYGERKKAYDAVKTAYQNVLVMVCEDGRLLALNETLRAVKGHVIVVEAKDGKTVFDGPFSVGANGRAELAKLAWQGQGMFRIAWTSDAGDGANHYLHGEPPFAWRDYSAWLAGPRVDEATFARMKRKALEKQRLVIWDDDGCDMTYYPYQRKDLAAQPASARNFEKVFLEATENTKTDVIGYSGTMGFGYFTQLRTGGYVNTNLFAAANEPWRNAVNEFAAKGLDSMDMATAFARRNGKEIFLSLRFNDNHDVSSTLEKPNCLFSPFKMKNPETMVGFQRSVKCCGRNAADFAQPKVREFVRTYVRGYLENYDLDGIEFDFFRHPQFFRTVAMGGVATDEELRLMTDLMRDFRAMAEEIGRRRGRPFVLCARVPDSVGYCKAIGIDLDAWGKAKVLDFLIVGGYFHLEPWRTMADYVHALGMKCYASLDETRLNNRKGVKWLPGRNDKECWVARIAAAMASGMDGVNLFNVEYFNHDDQRWILRHDIRDLEGVDKIYFATYVGGGGYLPKNFLTDWQRHVKTTGVNPFFPTALKVGETHAFELIVGDDFAAAARRGKRAETEICVLADAQGGARLSVALNGKPLDAGRVEGDVLAFKVAPEQIVRGVNAVTVTANAPLNLHDFRLTAKFREEGK